MRSQFTITPPNIAVATGRELVLYCDGEHLGWVKYPPGKENPIIISTNGTVSNGNRYRLYSGYTLVIDAAILDDAGTYRCVYEPLPTLYREADVFVGEMYDV